MARPKKIPVVNSSNSLDFIMEFEGGNMTRAEFLALFAYLIKTGQAWHLQGMYGRQAAALIEDGRISKSGVINWSKVVEPEKLLYKE